jgi:hypothetical protein
LAGLVKRSLMNVKVLPRARELLTDVAGLTALAKESGKTEGHPNSPGTQWDRSERLSGLLCSEKTWAKSANALILNGSP